MDQDFSGLLVQICRAQRNLAAAALDAIHMHVGQENLVYRLAAEEGVSQAQLAGALCLDASTVTKMLLRLERDGSSSGAPMRRTRVSCACTSRRTARPWSGRCSKSGVRWRSGSPKG